MLSNLISIVNAGFQSFIGFCNGLDMTLLIKVAFFLWSLTMALRLLDNILRGIGRGFRFIANRIRIPRKELKLPTIDLLQPIVVTKEEKIS